MSDSNRISDLSKTNQRTVRRLWKQKPVSIDKITGLFYTIQNNFYAENPDFEPSGWSKPTTEVNYAPVPGPMKTYADPSELFHYIDPNGSLEISVEKGNRVYPSRTGIHVHESAGVTFVMRGKSGITDFVEGRKNSYNPKGDYYYMPANTPMAAANYSGADSILMDLFITPPGTPTLTVIEPGYPGYVPG